MRNKKKIAIGLLVVMLLGMSMGVNAKAGTQAAAHTHTYNITNYIVAYVSVNEAQHQKNTTPVFTCSTCGATYMGNKITATEDHSYSGWSWTGQNYHDGTLHRFLYARTCSICNHSQQDWRSKSCPGSSAGNCPMPYSLFIEP